MSNVDIHRYSEQLQTLWQRIQSHPDINEANKDDLEEYWYWLEHENDDVGSDSRIYAYLSRAKKVCEHNPSLRLKNLDREAIVKINRQIERSEYYHSEYSEETKKEYRKFLRSYYKWANDGHDVPEKAAWLSTTVDEDPSDRVSPDEIPGPDDVKKVCQKLPSFYYRTFLLTLYDLGRRIGEVLPIRMEQITVKDDMVSVYIYGNKESDNKKRRLVVSWPAVKRFIEDEHPCPENNDAFLFYSKHDPEKARSYRDIRRKLIAAMEDSAFDGRVNPHAFRKARFTFWDKINVNATIADRLLGHVEGSQTGKAYRKLDDDDENEALMSVYGYEEQAASYEDDLLPLECKECGSVNPGWRDRCLECQGLLEIKEAGSESVVETVLDQLEAIELAGQDVDIDDEQELVRKLVRQQLE